MDFDESDDIDDDTDDASRRSLPTMEVDLALMSDDILGSKSDCWMLSCTPAMVEIKISPLSPCIFSSAQGYTKIFNLNGVCSSSNSTFSSPAK